jgi:TolA-binding protein
MYRRILRALFGCTTLFASPVLAAESLVERAPDLDALHDLLSPAPPEDAEDRDELELERNELIAVLEASLERNAAPLARSRDLYELAQQHRGRSAYLLDQAKARHAEAYDRYFVGDQASTPALKLDAYKEELLKSLSTLRDLLAHSPTHARRDELNFLIATTLARVGNDHCEAYFKQAIERAKSSDWALKSRIGRADYLVGKGRFDEAVKLYEEARKTAPTRLKAYATYRLGWAVLQKTWDATDKTRQEAQQKAAVAFKLTVALLEDDDEDEDSRLQLRTEAARDLVWLWARAGVDKEPLAFLEKHDLEDLTPFYLEHLAREQIERRQLDKAAATYRALLAEEPEHPRAPDFSLRLARAHYLEGNLPAVKAELLALSAMSSNPENPWFDEYEDDTPRIERVKRMAALLPLSGGFTLARAAEGEKNPVRKKKLLEGAVSELSAYTKANANDPQLPVVRMALASAYLQLARHKDALAELDALYLLGDKAGAHREAIVTERLSLVIKLDAAQQYPALPAPGEVKKPIPLPELKQRFARYAEDYLKVMPASEQTLPLRFQIAQDLFLYGHYDESMRRFEALVTEHPGSEQAKVAIEVLLSMNLKRARWDELVRLSTAFLNNRAVKGKALREYVKENLDYAKSRQTSGT